jgi:hypothetical protein
VLTACGANPIAANRFDIKRGTTRWTVTAGPDSADAVRVTGSVVDEALSGIRGEATTWLTLSTTFCAAATALSCVGAGWGAAARNIDDAAGRVDGTVSVIDGRRLLDVVGDDEVLVSTSECDAAGAPSSSTEAPTARRTASAIMWAGLEPLAAPAAALCDTTGLRGLGVVLSRGADEEFCFGDDFAEASDSDADDLEVDESDPESGRSAHATPVPAAMPTPSDTTKAPIRPACAVAAAFVGLITCAPVVSLENAVSQTSSHLRGIYRPNLPTCRRAGPAHSASTARHIGASGDYAAQRTEDFGSEKFHPQCHWSKYL